MKPAHELCAALASERRWRILYILRGGYPTTINLVCARLGMEAAINSPARQAVRRDLEALVDTELIEKVPDENPVVYRLSHTSVMTMFSVFRKALGTERLDAR